MLIIDDIKIQALRSIGPAPVRHYDSLLLPDDTRNPKVLVLAILTAYDLGELASLTRHSNPNYLSATFHQADTTYRLSARVKSEDSWLLCNSVVSLWLDIHNMG